MTEDGEKELLAVEGGYRESKDSWAAVLRSLIDRGLAAPMLAIGDGALGFWAALRSCEGFEKTREQRCWVHKIANVLDKLPKRLQPKAKDLLHEIMRAAQIRERLVGVAFDNCLKEGTRTPALDAISYKMTKFNEKRINLSGKLREAIQNGSDDSSVSPLAMAASSSRPIFQALLRSKQ